ncbi:hypothetical protein MMC18_009242 [Xylographa bjoerkii]|nr:hypothetical protein [Xylographa bjoerkii]
MTSNDIETELQGIDQSKLDLIDSTGKTALMWATRRQDDKAVALLIKAGANVNMRDHRGLSALLFAAKYSSSTCLRTLLDAGAEPATVDDGSRSALHLAARNTDVRDLIELLITVGVPVNGRSGFAGMPLTQAACSNKRVVAEALLDYGANINARDNDGDNALHEALHYHSDDVTQLLIARGINYMVLNSDGDSILHQAALSGGLRTLQILHNAGLKHMDPDAPNRRGLSALQLARERVGTPEGFVQKLSELLSDIRLRNNSIRMARENALEGHRQTAKSPQEIPFLTWLLRATSHAAIVLSYWARHILIYIRIVLSTTIRTPSWRRRVIVLCAAGFVYVEFIAKLRLLMQALAVLWQVVGPGGIEEL